MNSFSVFMVAAGIVLWMFITFTLNRRAFWVWLSMHAICFSVYVLVKNVPDVKDFLAVAGIGIAGIIVGTIVYYIIRSVIYYFAWDDFIFDDDRPPRDDYDSL